MSEPLIRRINREQMCWRAVDVEQLIGEDHVARAIWDLVGGLRLDGFYEGIECSEEEGGRPAYDPRLLISLWIYAYSQGIGSGAGTGAALRVGAGAAVADGMRDRELPHAVQFSGGVSGGVR